MTPAQKLFSTAVVRVLLIATIFGGLGALVGGWTFGFAIVSLVALLGFSYHAWKLAQLSSWLTSDHSAASVPDGWGTWGEVLADLYRLIRHERVSQQSLADSLGRFQEAANALPDGAVMLDTEHNIVWCNPAAELHWQISLANDRMQSITYFIRYPEFSEYLTARNFNAPLTLRFSQALKIGGARDITLAVKLIPFGNDQMLLLSQDISERERLETMRSDFVANVSHELRTPLTVMSGFLETMQKIGVTNPDLLIRSLDHMTHQAIRMQRLVSDLLTLSRLEDAYNKLNESVIDMAALTASAFADATALSNNQHTLTSSVNPGWLIGNRDEISSAVTNLVSNAVRYTPAGGTIHVALVINEASELVFSVKDNGEGIAPEHLPRLTERFYRVDRGRSREAGGTGLGLAIVKHVLMRHGAKLDIDSTQQLENHGSLFRITFPATRTIREQPKPQAVAA